MSQGLDPETIADSTYTKEFHKIMEEMIKYINSNPNNNTYVGETKAKRRELFIDSDTNTSVSTYLRDLSSSVTNKRGVNTVLKNALYSRFSYTTGTEGELSLIKYNNTATDNLDEEILYNAIPELILANLPLPPRNGKPYSTKQLGEDLVAYSFLEGGVQEATQFSKFIPVQLMEVMGQLETRGDKEIFVPINRKLQMFNNRENSPTFFDKALGIQENDIASFTRQYFQNNPRKAKKAYKPKFTETGVLLYENKQGKSPKFITYDTVEEGKKVTNLYENVGLTEYRKIEIVGQSGIKEYSYKQNEVTSVFNIESTVENKPTIIQESKILDTITVNSFTTPEVLLEQIQNLNFSEDQKYLAETAKWLTPLLKEGLVDIQFSGTLYEKKGAVGFTSRPDSQGKILISLDANKFAQMTKEKGSELVIHEVLHSVAVSHLTEYFDNSGKTLKSGVFVPPHVENLLQAFNAARKVYEAEVTALEKKIENNQIKGNPKVEFTDRELNVIYGLTNIFEFVSVAMTSEDFHNEFKSVPYLQSSKSIFNKIEDFFITMLDNIFPGLKEDSVAKASILASMKFIQEERTKVPAKTVVQPSLPNANVAITYGKSIEVPLNERVTQKYPETVVDPLTKEKLDTELLLKLSNEELFTVEFSYDDFPKANRKEELTKLFGESMATYLMEEYIPTDQGITYQQIKDLADKGEKGIQILKAFEDYWNAAPIETTYAGSPVNFKYYINNLLNSSVEYIDKNQTKLFEEEGEAMISNNLSTFDTSIENLGITKKEWDNLSIEEQDRIKKCN